MISLISACTGWRSVFFLKKFNTRGNNRRHTGKCWIHAFVGPQVLWRAPWSCRWMGKTRTTWVSGVPISGWVSLTQWANSSATGIFTLARTIKRDIPSKPNNKTHDYIHPSVLAQKSSYPHLEPILKAHPELVCELQQLEKQFKALWANKFNAESPRAQAYATKLKRDHDVGIWNIGSRVSRMFSRSVKKKTGVSFENGKPLLERNAVGDFAVKAGLPVTETRPPILSSWFLRSLPSNHWIYHVSTCFIVLLIELTYILLILNRTVINRTFVWLYTLTPSRTKWGSDSNLDQVFSRAPPWHHSP